MSKQATLTSFFHARKATADGADLHAIKKRKVELQDDLGKNVSQNAMACSLKTRIFDATYFDFSMFSLRFEIHT